MTMAISWVLGNLRKKVVCTELYKVSVSREGRRQRRLSTQAADRYVFEAVGL
jgi:hypothetical protein